MKEIFTNVKRKKIPEMFLYVDGIWYMRFKPYDMPNKIGYRNITNSKQEKKVLLLDIDTKKHSYLFEVYENEKI